MTTTPDARTKSARNASIVSAWLAGTPAHKLARQHGVSEQRIREIVRRARLLAGRVGVEMKREGR